MNYIYVMTLLCFAFVVTGKYSNNGLRHIKLGLKLLNTNMTKMKENWIEQPLNHYNPYDNRTLKMRYFDNLEYWKPNGPIYVYLGGEESQVHGIVSDERLLIVQLAKETNGVMFNTEHRYYGKSLPNIPKDDKIKYFKYLSSEQALADNANLFKMVKSDPRFVSSPVVVIGTSYAGNLAVWMRVLYPDLVDAAVAISAPVLAKKDFQEYLDAVRYTFAKYGTENCLQNIEKRFKRYENLLKSEAGIKTLKEELEICPKNDLTLLKNKQCLFTHLYYNLKTDAQYGQPAEVKYTCSEYGSNKKVTLYQFLNRTKLRHNDCINVDNCFTSNDPDYVSWTYQYCTEFGYLQTTSSEKQPFVHWNPLNYWVESCKGFVEGDIEKRIDEGVAKTNKLYGGLKPKVSKVVFAHGDMDPWRALGVQYDLGPDAPAIIVNGTAHCDLFQEKEGEPDEMKEKRKYVKDLIKKWIMNK